MVGIAFILGITGSLHCVGMCGPLALLVSGAGSRKLLFNRLLYHLGKASTYVILGVVIGFFGELFHLSEIQHILTIGIGVAMIIYVIAPSAYSFNIGFLQKGVSLIRTAIGRHVKSSRAGSSFLFGVLNGLLPCGLVYMALVAAATQPTAMQSAVFMLAFAMGTFPLLFAFTFSITGLKRFVRMPLEKMRMTFLFLVALFLITRGYVDEMAHRNMGSHQAKITICP